MPFLPLGDENKRLRIRLPAVTWGLIGLCFLVFIYQEGISPREWVRFVQGFGFIPALLSGEAALPSGEGGLPAFLTLLSYQFLHGNWDHLLGNLLFLWIFGDNIEDAMGHWRFLLFYLLCGIVAALAHYVIDPGSVRPLIGASGAISGVLGAYLLLHPFARITVLLVILPLRLPAWFLLIGWFAFQFVALGDGDLGDVAWLAHIAGFLAGALLLPLFKDRRTPYFARTENVKGISLPRRGRKPAKSPSAGQVPRRDRDPPPERGPWG